MIIKYPQRVSSLVSTASSPTLPLRRHRARHNPQPTNATPHYLTFPKSIQQQTSPPRNLQPTLPPHPAHQTRSVGHSWAKCYPQPSQLPNPAHHHRPPKTAQQAQPKPSKKLAGKQHLRVHDHLCTPNLQAPTRKHPPQHLPTAPTPSNSPSNGPNTSKSLPRTRTINIHGVSQLRLRTEGYVLPVSRLLPRRGFQQRCRA